METMLDKITGKKRPESDETATERPEGTHGPSGNGEEENMVIGEKEAQLANELENLKKTYELMLAGDYESVKDASGAGHSPKKQEGDVHGYEQEEVTEEGDSTGKTDIVDGESKIQKDEIEEVHIPVIDYERGKELSGDTHKVDIEIYSYGLQDSMFGRSHKMNLIVKAWISKSKVYSFNFESVEVFLFKKKVNDYVEMMIRIDESVIAHGYKAKIDLKVSSEYKIRSL